MQYVLSVVKAIAPQSSPVAVADTPKSTAAFTTDVPSMVAIVKRHVPTATVSSDVGQELQLRLPLGAVSTFPLLFEELEVCNSLIDMWFHVTRVPLQSRRAELGFVTFGIGTVTLEDVFLKVGKIGRTGAYFMRHSL